ncbi:alpha/beta fold hydrolase [Scytonema millei]|uniref:alpha/beta fold hydrolase n=1 Tax=Scytonema millei TaxID=1245922 RepID=UPI001912E31C|nr:alpha/beta hydrolase [Scytonema millei]
MNKSYHDCKNTRSNLILLSFFKYARDLEAVLSLAGDKRAILLGHSMGGMTILRFCRLFPEYLMITTSMVCGTHQVAC